MRSVTAEVTSRQGLRRISAGLRSLANDFSARALTSRNVARMHSQQTTSIRPEIHPRPMAGRGSPVQNSFTDKTRRV